MVEVPGFPKGNVHDIPDAAFEIVADTLQQEGIGIYCFGSAIMNWAKTIATPFDVTLGEVKRAIPRMQRLKTKYVRIMSFKPGDNDDVIPPVVFERVREVTKMFRDAGLQPVHENCMNYGGMSWEHTLKLLDNVPGLKLVFDTGNPIVSDDRRRPKPYPKQSAWEFYSHVRDRVVYVHVKDGYWDETKKKAVFTFPGEGKGDVWRIMADLLQRGYDGGISIEPHLAVVFHDPSVTSPEAVRFANYVEYGRRMMKMVDEIRAAQKPAADVERRPTGAGRP
jgi:sugar phosphate isomerase/epimerase